MAPTTRAQRQNIIDEATTMPAARLVKPACASRARAARDSATAVDDTSPPNNPVSRVPLRAPSRRMAT